MSEVLNPPKCSSHPYSESADAGSVLEAGRRCWYFSLDLKVTASSATRPTSKCLEGEGVLSRRR